MKALLVTTLLVLPLPSVYAAADEEVVRTLARQSGISPEEIRANYDACGSGTTLAMKICGAYHLTEQDIQLNRIYKEALVKAREAGYEASLLKAQRAWLAYRDAACAFEGEMGAGGGTAEGLYVLSCKTELTSQRAARLEASIKD